MREWTDPFLTGIIAFVTKRKYMLWIKLRTWFKGDLVGNDLFGNQYYREKGEETLFKEYGFEKYYDFYIKPEWITDNLPYDRMAMSKNDVIKYILLFKKFN